MLGGWLVVATATLAVGVGAFLLVEASEATPSAISVQVGACSGLTVSSGHWPTRAPERELNMTLVDGERVAVLQEPGIWRAKLEAEGALIAPWMPPGQPAARSWTDDYGLAWCHDRPENATFLVRGDGILHVRSWEGTDAKFRAR